MQPYRFSINWELDFAGLRLFTWTAPASLRCGDLLTLYEAQSGGGRGAIVAVGRAVTDSMRAYGGDGTYWAWVQWRTLAHPLNLSVARSFGPFSVQGRHSKIDLDVFKALSARIARGNPSARAILARWKTGGGFPRTDEVPIRDLIRASYGLPTRESDAYPAIEAWLAERGWRALPDEILAARKGLRGPLSFDPQTDRALRPDILMCRPAAKRLLVVEVKRVAVPTQGYRNPPDQVVDYARALSKTLRENGIAGWSIEPLLVAEDFSPVVLDEARAHRGGKGIAPLECRMWDGEDLGPNIAK